MALKSGDRGDSVRNLQKKLKAAGYDPGDIDGVFGPETRAAVRDFQDDHGLVVDGLWGPKSSEALNSGKGPKERKDGGRTNKQTRREEALAAEYGWAAATIAAIPEVQRLFDKATDRNWTPERFQMEVRRTDWYKKNGETVRAAIALKATDPATYRNNVRGAAATIAARAVQMGAHVSPREANKLADSMVMFGWNDAQLQTALGKFVKSVGGQLRGAAQAAETELQAYAQNMGVSLSDKWIRERAVRIAQGKLTSDDALGSIQNTAESTWPQFKNRIQAGETISDIADPYIQQMARTLELSPEKLTVYDKTIRGALSSKDKNGNPSMKSVWEFENDLRKDSRWRKTKNAQDAGTAVLNSLGKMFGDIA